MSISLKNILLYSISTLIWGSTWFAITLQLDHADPMASVAYRFLLASVMMFIYCVAARKNLRFGFRTHLFIFLQGFFSFTFSYWLVYLAEMRLTSGLVAVICSFLIFLNIVNRSLLLKFKINRLVLFGAALGVIGIVLIFLPEMKTQSFSHETWISIILVFIATLFYSFGNIVAERNIRNGIPVIQSNAFGMGYAALIMIAFALFSGKSLAIDPQFPYLASLAYLSVFGSVITFYCYFTLIGNIGSDKAAYGPVVVPVIALFLSALYEDYHWSGYAVAGIVLLIVGNFLVLNKKSMNREVT
ncbi:DMT family transporter [bacterium]|nr:DMT family transporter [bacterium]